MNDAPILICYDGSAGATHAIEVAAALLGPRHAVVVDIVPPLTPEESFAAVGPGVPGYAFEDTNLMAANERADQGAKIARTSGFDAESRGVVAAPTWEGIADVADELDAPVIVMGSRGLSGGRALVEGSVSRQVAEHAGRPVLIVPPHDGHGRRS
jgi:nucleotide-binding universal stress UspA family protein